MTLNEYRASQQKRIVVVSHTYGVTGLVLAVLLAVQGIFIALESSLKDIWLGRRRISHRYVSSSGGGSHAATLARPGL